VEEYEHVAAKAYRLASEHSSADEWLSEAVSTLSGHVIDARRLLNYVEEQYLRIWRDKFFAMGAK
jgi:hypothetical protein